jgi:hypothetical protein
LGSILSYAYKNRKKVKSQSPRKHIPLKQLFRKLSIKERIKRRGVFKFFYKSGGQYKRRNRTFARICKKWEYTKKLIKNNTYLFKRKQKVLKKYRHFFVKTKKYKMLRQPLFQQQTQ